MNTYSLYRNYSGGPKNKPTLEVSPGDTLKLKLCELDSSYAGASLSFAVKKGSLTQDLSGVANALPAFPVSGTLSLQLPNPIVNREYSLTLVPTQTGALDKNTSYVLEIEVVKSDSTVESWQFNLTTGQDIVENVIPAAPAVPIIGAVLTGLSLTVGGVISASDSILSAFGKLQNQISGKVNKTGDTMTGKLTVRNEVEINNSSITGDNNGVIQKIDEEAGKGVFRWLFNNASSFPVIASFFRASDNTLDYVEFSGRVKASAPTESTDVVRKQELDAKFSGTFSGTTVIDGKTITISNGLIISIV